VVSPAVTLLQTLKDCASSADTDERRASMPQVTIKTGFIAANGQEEVLTEYLCDWPGCANVAENMVGVALELRIMCVVCHEHTIILPKPTSGSDAD
jgi:hypothetical protein